MKVRRRKSKGGFLRERKEDGIRTIPPAIDLRLRERCHADSSWFVA